MKTFVVFLMIYISLTLCKIKNTKLVDVDSYFGIYIYVIFDKESIFLFFFFFFFFHLFLAWGV